MLDMVKDFGEKSNFLGLPMGRRDGWEGSWEYIFIDLAFDSGFTRIEPNFWSMVEALIIWSLKIKQIRNVD